MGNLCGRDDSAKDTKYLDINAGEHKQYKQIQSTQPTVPDTPVKPPAAAIPKQRTDVVAGESTMKNGVTGQANAAVGNTSNSALSGTPSSVPLSSSTPQQKSDATQIKTDTKIQSAESAQESSPATQSTVVLKDAKKAPEEPVLTVHPTHGADQASLHRHINNVANDSEVKEYADEQQKKVQAAKAEQQQMQRNATSAAGHPAAINPPVNAAIPSHAPTSNASPAAVQPTVSTKPTVLQTTANTVKSHTAFDTNAAAPVTSANTVVPQSVKQGAAATPAGWSRKCSRCGDVKTDKSEYSAAQMKKPLDSTKCKTCVAKEAT